MARGHKWVTEERGGKNLRDVKYECPLSCLYFWHHCQDRKVFSELSMLHIESTFQLRDCSLITLVETEPWGFSLLQGRAALELPVMVCK